MEVDAAAAVDADAARPVAGRAPAPWPPPEPAATALAAAPPLESDDEPSLSCMAPGERRNLRVPLTKRRPFMGVDGPLATAGATPSSEETLDGRAKPEAPVAQPDAGAPTPPRPTAAAPSGR